MSSSLGNVQRLLDAGIVPRDLVTIAKGAVISYDLNRKPHNGTIRALGLSACSVYERMLDEDDDWEPRLTWLLALQPFTAEATAARCHMSRGTAASSVDRLIEHGFMERQRFGRSYLARLMIPSIALTEYAERHLDAWEPQMAGYLEHQHLAERVQALYPRRPTGSSADDR